MMKYFENIVLGLLIGLAVGQGCGDARILDRLDRLSTECAK